MHDDSTSTVPALRTLLGQGILNNSEELSRNPLAYEENS